MKNYPKSERQEHVENWKKGTLSKAAYAKSVGIIPTTFYNWTNGKKSKKQGLIEIPETKLLGEEPRQIHITQGALTVSVPVCVEMKQLRKVFEALGAV